jgi:hypothetical protein
MCERLYLSVVSASASLHSMRVERAGMFLHANAWGHVVCAPEPYVPGVIECKRWVCLSRQKRWYLPRPTSIEVPEP